MKIKIYTIGHSNRLLEPFLSLLKAFRIQAVADVRRFPSSRKFPHFNQPHLCDALDAQGIEYQWFEDLGGRRHKDANRDSPNTGIDEPAFRNYADYMLTDGFEAAIKKLCTLAERRVTSILCAEKLYTNCHRRLLSDFLEVRGLEVEHIKEAGQSKGHERTPYSKVIEGGKIIYPSPLFS
jgi:uncharacterized protein (DUF488 family)